MGFLNFLGTDPNTQLSRRGLLKRVAAGTTAATIATGLSTNRATAVDLSAITKETGIPEPILRIAKNYTIQSTQDLFKKLNTSIRKSNQKNMDNNQPLVFSKAELKNLTEIVADNFPSRPRTNIPGPEFLIADVINDNGDIFIIPTPDPNHPIHTTGVKLHWVNTKDFPYYDKLPKSLQFHDGPYYTMYVKPIVEEDGPTEDEKIFKQDDNGFAFTFTDEFSNFEAYDGFPSGEVFPDIRTISYRFATDIPKRTTDHKRDGNRKGPDGKDLIVGRNGSKARILVRDPYDEKKDKQIILGDRKLIGKPVPRPKVNYDQVTGKFSEKKFTLPHEYNFMRPKDDAQYIKFYHHVLQQAV